MIPVFTAAEMRRCDAVAIEQFGVPGIVLMENAAHGALQVIERMFEPLSRSTAIVLCGKGNNGGDGFAIARHLVNRGVAVHVMNIGPDEASRGDAATNLTILRIMEASMPSLRVTLLSDVRELRDELLHGCTFVVDALLGTGLSSEVSDEIVDIVDILAHSSVPIISIDIPTGIDSDNGAILGSAMRAAATVTMAGLKRGLLFGRGKEYAGEVTVVDIGSPSVVLHGEATSTWRLERSDIIARLPHRGFDVHKYQLGKVFVLAGSIGLSGAAAMSSMAALRTGAGIVKLGVPASLNAIMEVKLTEIMTIPYRDTSEGSLGMQDLEGMLDMIESSTVSVIGPGISRQYETQNLVRKLVARASRPLVVDADALFALAGHLDILLGIDNEIVLTPHTGEFSRMIDQSIADIEAKRIDLARTFATEFAVTLVLKGAPTIIATKDGHVYINATGNPGMATAGSGDVLTGVIAGLIAQGASPEDAALCGVYLHGMAGDRAREQVGEYGLIATDMLTAVAETIHDLGEVHAVA